MDDCTDPCTWLQHQIELHDEKSSQISTQDVKLPTRNDGKHYCIKDCKEDQNKIIAFILSTLKEWISLPSKYGLDSSATFAPLRLTICGEAGSGKSVLIHTIISMIRKILNITDSAVVLAPTGSAAFNAGGKTLHSFFGIRGQNDKGPHISASI